MLIARRHLLALLLFGPLLSSACGVSIPSAPEIDEDGDGYTVDVDCDDANGAVWQITEVLLSDRDGDGYGDAIPVCTGFDVPADAYAEHDFFPDDATRSGYSGYQSLSGSSARVFGEYRIDIWSRGLAAVSKVGSAGDVLWTRSFSDSEDRLLLVYPTIRDVAVDSQDNVYISGAFGETTDFDPSEGEALRTPNAWHEGERLRSLYPCCIDAFLLKLDADGDFVWVETLGGPDRDEFRDIEVVSDDQIIVSFSASNLGSDTRDGDHDHEEIDLVPAVDEWGRMSGWSYGGGLVEFNAEGELQGMRLAGDENPYPQSTAIRLRDDEFLSVMAGGLYAKDGGNVYYGCEIWKDQILNGPVDLLDYPFIYPFPSYTPGGILVRHCRPSREAIFANSPERVYFADAEPRLLSDEPGDYVFDMLVTALSGSLEQEWSRRFNGEATDLGLLHVVTDSLGRVYVAGSFAGTLDFDPDSDAGLRSSMDGREDIFVLQLHSDGSFGWIVTFPDPGSDFLSSIGPSDDGRIRLIAYGLQDADFTDGIDPTEGGYSSLMIEF